MPLSPHVANFQMTSASAIGRDSAHDRLKAWRHDRECMLIRVGCELVFEFPRPAAMVLMLYLHPSRSPTIRRAERLESEPWLPAADLYGQLRESLRPRRRPNWAGAVSQ